MWTWTPGNRVTVTAQAYPITVGVLVELVEQESFYPTQPLQLVDLKEPILFFQQLHQQVVDKHLET